MDLILQLAQSKFASIPKKYKHISFKPPQEVANAASKGLGYRKKQKGNKAGLTPEEASKEGIGSGVQRAVNLKNRDEVSPEVIRKMVGFFSRHEKNKSIDPKHKNEPWEDNGYVSWLLWGGDPGKKWAEKTLKQMEEADEKMKKATILKIARNNKPFRQKLIRKLSSSQDFASLSKALENEFRKYFPRGFIQVKKKKSIGELLILVRFSLLPEGQQTNRIIENDPSYNQFFIQGENGGSPFLEEEMLTPKIRVEMVQGNKLYGPNASNPQKIGWRNGKGTPQSIVRKFSKYFQKIRRMVDQREDLIL